KGNGTIGDISSMGLAMQALGATTKFYAPRKWNRTQALDVVAKHDYELAMAIAQVLPALVNKSYLDVGSFDCDATTDECPSLGTHRVSRANTGNIRVHYSITNKIQGQHFHYFTWVTVPLGSTLLKVMEKAEEEDPKIF
ncbi:IF factor, partial [Xiphorhynchus elegans]|nr:IF factor [Xiphorhynchus elegans]